MVQFALSESLAPNVRLVSAANGAAVVSLLPHRIRYRVDARRWLTPSFPSPASCRIRKFHSRCSNVNSDVQFNHVVADDEFFPSEGSSIQGDFLAPVVQHNTGILETPSFGLLVLSEEEKNALAATPAHPPGLYDPKKSFFDFLQAAAQVLSAMMIIHDHTVATTSSSSVVLGPWFVVLVLAGSIEKLCGVPLGIANGRDWVVQLAVTSKPIALAQANAVLSRIDMLAEVFPGFVAYSWRVNVWGSSFQVWSSDVPEIFLYFDDRFTASDGVSPSTIGGFTGLCAAMGLVATFLAANFVKRLGILKAVAFGFIFQASFLLMVVTVYWSGSLSHQSPIIFFLGLIALSRLGYMSIVVAGAQILQTGIPSSEANLIGITEALVASLAESLMLGVAIVANDASHYGTLALLSVTAVVGSAWIFCRWAINPTPEQGGSSLLTPLLDA
ncbi:unnamed protein product [Linum tenue]|uniref:Solute carrier family 40 member n=1 Tax=Linum tenue TaxID=586396 RepID=A0AAV0MJJ8_9ROSI|nr:unnamed protein product [Linum tenue]